MEDGIGEVGLIAQCIREGIVVAPRGTVCPAGDCGHCAVGAIAGAAFIFIAGTLKIVYDLLLYKAFLAIQPPEER